MPAGAPTLVLGVVLNEVHYDPAGADGGREYVELAAAGAAPDASLDGWRLETGNGAASDGDWKVAWIGAAADRLEEGLFVIGEADVLPPPHVVADLDLQNGPDACRLVSPGGATDVCGWGHPLPDGLFEGTPAADVASGQSLSRQPDARDTGDNAADFAAGDPTPGTFNSPEHWLAVESVEWPAADAPVGEAWRFVWSVRNRGRAAWSGTLRVVCAVHPREVLASVAPAESLPSGSRATWESWGTPPPGVHLPRSDPPPSDGRASPAWSGRGTLLHVTEVLAAPPAGEPEWVELYAEAETDLSSYRLEDAAGARTWLRGSVGAARHVVLTPDADAFRRRWGDVDRLTELSPWPSINHSAPPGAVAEELVVTLVGKTVAVAVIPGGGETGITWERVARSLPGDSVTSWGLCLDRAGGTPGLPNSRRGDRSVPPGGGMLRVLPQPYRPARDASALVVVSAGRGQCRIRIWDSAGRLVATLSPWRHGRGWRAVWDGRRADGKAAPLGLYLVLAESEGNAPLRAPLTLLR